MTRNLNRILVPTDFSETASHAMRYASDLARRLSGRIVVVYSDPFTPPIDYTATMGGWDDSSFAHLKERTEEELKRDAKANVDPSVLYNAVVRVATPLEGILAQARESGAGLIVMGTHGRSGFRRLIIGSLTEAVMRKAEMPVIAVPLRSESTSAIKTVVCAGIDNDRCLEALAFAAAIVPMDARFIVVRTKPGGDILEAAGDLQELRSWVPESIAKRCELKLLGGGHVADQIGGYAGKVHADLIVAAEPADRSAADVLYGTFAARLVQNSDCPVLTVNHRAAPRAARMVKQEHWPGRAWVNQ